MVDITPLLAKGSKSITGYGGGGFKINQEFIAGSLLVLPEEVHPWGIAEGETPTLAHFSALEGKGIELLLVGTGRTIAPLLPELRAALKAMGMSVDVMDTGAACRTYNVLLSEERKVAAAVIAV
jgi:uncharacterized protein